MKKTVALALALITSLFVSTASADRYYNWTNPSCFPDRAGNCMQPGGRGAGRYYDPRPTARPGYRPYYNAPRQQYVGPRGEYGGGRHHGGSYGHGGGGIHVPPQKVACDIWDENGNWMARVPWRPGLC